MVKKGKKPGVINRYNTENETETNWDTLKQVI